MGLRSSGNHHPNITITQLHHRKNRKKEKETKKSYCTSVLEVELSLSYAKAQFTYFDITNLHLEALVQTKKTSCMSQEPIAFGRLRPHPHYCGRGRSFATFALPVQTKTVKMKT